MVTYEDILSLDKLIDVYKNICLTTEHKAKLITFELNFSCNMIDILQSLEQYKYHHDRYSLFLISEPKHRLIMSEKIKDKIVNHLVSKYVLLPTLSPKLIDMNVATRKDKGTKAAIFYMKKYINYLKYHHDKIYVLKCDIRKYFYNIDHQILKNKLKNDIKDVRLQELIGHIIDSTDESYINKNIEILIHREISRLKKKDISNRDEIIKKLLSIPLYKKGKGLPIGNETSQILAIYYLSELDHYIKEKLRIKCYIRYMDDFVLLHHDKEYLKECLSKIKEKLKEFKLDLNEKTQLYDLSKGVNFLGYRFKLKNKKTIILLNNQTKKRIKRKLRKLKKENSPHYTQVLASYYGYFKMSDSGNFIYHNHFYKDIKNIKNKGR